MDKNIFDKLVPEYVQKLSSDEVTDLFLMQELMLRI